VLVKSARRFSTAVKSLNNLSPQIDDLRLRIGCASRKYSRGCKGSTTQHRKAAFESVFRRGLAEIFVFARSTKELYRATVSSSAAAAWALLILLTILPANSRKEFRKEPAFGIDERAAAQVHFSRLTASASKMAQMGPPPSAFPAVHFRQGFHQSKILSQTHSRSGGPPVDLG